MKLSKSKLALAKVINENGGWQQDSEWAVQNGDHGRISFSINKPVRNDSKSWVTNGGFNFKIEVCKPLKNWHQNVLNREEYYQAYPMGDADGWIEWSGEPKSPVEIGVLVDVKLKGGGYHEAELLDDASWSDAWGDESIIAYRLHKPEVKPEFCESVMRSIPDPESKPTIEQLAQDYRNKLDFAKRKQQEADDAKAAADAALGELERAGEDLGLVVTPITAKQDSGLVITDWRDLIEGDVVFVDGMTCAENEFSVAMIGRECTVVSDGDMYPVCLMNEFTPPGESYWLGGCCDEISWRFIRRP